MITLNSSSIPLWIRLPIRMVIKGTKVQEVGYRIFLLGLAEALGISGFQARNLEDGTLEVLASGNDEAIRGFIDAARRERPKRAVVESIKVEEHRGYVMGVESYYRMLSLEQLSKIVDAGLDIRDGQERLIEGQDKLLKGQERLIEGQDKLLKGQERLEKRLVEGHTSIVNEIRDLRRDLREILDKRLAKLEEDVARIKVKLGIE